MNLASVADTQHMQPNASSHLLARLAIGAPVGSRVEVVSVGEGMPLRLGDTGTLLSIEHGLARLSVDMHGVVEVDPMAVCLRPLLRPAA
jgi:hypothetical protein